MVCFIYLFEYVADYVLGAVRVYVIFVYSDLWRDLVFCQLWVGVIFLLVFLGVLSVIWFVRCFLLFVLVRYAFVSLRVEGFCFFYVD